MAELREFPPPPQAKAEVPQQRRTRVNSPGRSTVTVWPFFFQTSAVSLHIVGHVLVWVAEDTNLSVSVLRRV